jgi:hypothetical protein
MKTYQERLDEFVDYLCQLPDNQVLGVIDKEQNAVNASPNDGFRCWCLKLAKTEGQRRGLI